MKIALICTEKLPVPPVAGGAIQLYIDGILPYISRKHKITVISLQHPDLQAEEVKDGIRYIRIPGKNTAEYVNNIKPHLSADFDLVHIFNRPLWILQLSKDLPGVKFTLSLHNEMFHREKISDDQAVECVNRVEFINTVSKFIAKTIEKRVPSAAGKLRVVYSGADIQQFSPAWSDQGLENKKRLKEKYKLKGYRVILFVGRLSEKKGVHILLRAIQKLTDTYSKIALVVVGSKWYGENKSDDYTVSLKRLTKEITIPIVFTGFVPPSEIPELYNMGDIFICASQWEEPLARVHYEAMAAGLPIITTNRGGNAEVVSGYKNGLVINDYKNPDTFADAIVHYLDHPDAAQSAGKAGRKLAEENFNWERVANEIFKPFEAEIADQPQPETPDKGGSRNESISHRNKLRRPGYRRMPYRNGP